MIIDRNYDIWLVICADRDELRFRIVQIII